MQCHDEQRDTDADTARPPVPAYHHDPTPIESPIPVKDAIRSRRDTIEWDPDCPGLGIRTRSRGGSGTWVVERRVHGPVTKSTVGPVSRVSRSEAQATARELIDGQTLGTSPSGVLVRQFIPTFMADSQNRWRSSTAAAVQRIFDRHIVPTFGGRRVIDIERADVLYWHDGLTASRDWSLSALSSLMLHAESLGIRKAGTSPCASIRRKRSSFKANYPTADVYARLSMALEAETARYPMEVELIRFLALTGARKGEALALRWNHLHGCRAVLPDSKTGPKTVWLPPSVQQSFEARKPSKPSGYVFSNGRPMLPSRVQRLWSRVRVQAGCPRLRIHDLRHGFASTAVMLDADLRVISQLLGHSDFETTMGYAHLRQRHLAETAQRLSGRLAASLATIPPLPPPGPPDRLPADLRRAVSEYFEMTPKPPAPTANASASTSEASGRQ